MSIEIPIILSGEAILPAYQTAEAAGMDLCSAIDFELEPMQRLLIPTGIRMAIPVGFEGQVRPRSGLALRFGLSMVNSPGTIDSDYRGEIGVLLVNLGENRVALKKGDRVAQLVIAPISRASLTLVHELPESGRASGGFGSTGV